jgi:uncharacterized SAM-binding protein YcdF (DUF218 family)
MMFLRNTLLAFLVPPLGFVTIATLGLLLSLSRRFHRPGLIVVWIGIAALYAIATPVVSDTLLVALEGGLPLTPPVNSPPQAIVVLGAEVIRTKDSPKGVEVGRLTLERLRAAAALHRRTGLPILVTGGSTQPDTPPVGEMMAQSLREDFQVPVRWVEDRSRDTWENAALSAAILRAEQINSVYVVTHAWHERRAVISFRPTGLIVTAAPTALDQPLSPIFSDFMPRVSAWEYGYYALHEWIGCAWYAFR